MFKRSKAHKRTLQARAWGIFVTGVVLLLLGLGSGCNQFFGLEETQLAKGNAYACNCECQGGRKNINVNSLVCLPESLNPNLTGVTPSDDEVTQDCQNRVQNNVEQMAKQCVAARLTCTCTADVLADLSVRLECDEPCAGEDLAADCSNFDPQNGQKTATNVPGQAPVCLIASSDPPTPVPDPLAASLFGQSSQCAVEGQVTITRDGESQTRGTNGVAQFTGEPCPDAQCQVGMSYRLDHINSFSFDSFGGFDRAEFQELAASGATNEWC